MAGPTRCSRRTRWSTWCSSTRCWASAAAGGGRGACRCSPAHGEFPSAAHELVEYSAARWRARFERAGFRVDTIRPLGLVYDGYAFLPGLPFGVREALARLIGSACAVYVLSRAVDTPAAKPSRLA